jgi:rod shape-determining protein MreC
MAVITLAGLVGKTEDVSAGSCDVLLISDRNCKVAVRFDPSGVYGVMRGGGISARGLPRLDILANPKPFQVDFINKEAPIKPGDAVFTSGLGGLYPPDILVGYVSRTYPDESGLYQHAEVKPVADLARLRQVMVVIGQRKGE